MEGGLTLSISSEYPSCLQHVVDSVIQQHVEQYEEYVPCLGTIICDFFRIPHRFCSGRPSKHSKSKKLCRRCGRSLKRYILETAKSGFDIFQERRCSMINTINPTLYIINVSDLLGMKRTD